MTSKVDVAIIGAGPYGLSTAAHLQAAGIEFRIFGETMGSWKRNMPAGMLLKSLPWATNLSDPRAEYGVREFRTERLMPHQNESMPIARETFIEYGEAFRDKFVLEVEQKMLVALETAPCGMTAHFNDGETVLARRIILALGLTSFKHMPEAAGQLPKELCSHTADYGQLDTLVGKEVAIIGAGASATDLAALLAERGVQVSILTRGSELKFAGRPGPRRLWERVFAPASGIGNGWTMRLCANAPAIVHMLPESQRISLASAKTLGPLGGAFMSDRVLGKVPVIPDCDVARAEPHGAKVNLSLVSCDNTSRAMRFDHVMFATGYKIDIARLNLLARDLRSHMRLVGTAPQLSLDYEASIPGLHFIGPAATSSFGPVCRFVYGAGHPARRLAHYLPKILARAPARSSLLTNTFAEAAE